MLFRLLRKERADWALKPLAASPTQLQNQTSSFTPADFPGLGMSTRQALTEAEKSTSTTDITAGAPAYWFKHVQPHGGKVTSLAHYSKPHEVLLSVLWSVAEILISTLLPFRISQIQSKPEPGIEPAILGLGIHAATLTATTTDLSRLPVLNL